jgi:hypothetical protein
MTFFGKTIHFHKWRRVLAKERYTFRGVSCTRDVETNYRYCIECKSIQEHLYGERKGYWRTVPDCERKILLADILFERKEDKDEYAYFLVENYLRQNQ